MQIATAELSHDDYVRAVGQVVEFLGTAKVHNVLVAYGFGCNCPIDRLYGEVLMPLPSLRKFIEESQVANRYQLGRNDLHVKMECGRAEFLFCHEGDIHFMTEDYQLFEQLKAFWLEKGYKGLYEKTGTDWTPVRDKRCQDPLANESI